MKALVAVKRVIDYKAVIKIMPDSKNIDLAHVKMTMNPFDEIALEEAIRLKEKGIVSEITVLSIGAIHAQETLRTALAMGADKALLIETIETLPPLSVAVVLQKVIAQNEITLVLLGKQAVDSDNNQVGQMLAGRLNWSQGTFASQLNFHDNGVSVTREIDEGLETLFLTLPAVITADLRLNEPRYISLPNIIKAKQKSLDIVSLESLNLDLPNNIEIISLSKPEKKRKQIKLDSATQLINYLHHEEKVI